MQLLERDELPPHLAERQQRHHDQAEGDDEEELAEEPGGRRVDQAAGLAGRDRPVPGPELVLHLQGEHVAHPLTIRAGPGAAVPRLASDIESLGHTRHHAAASVADLRARSLRKPLIERTGHDIVRYPQRHGEPALNPL